MYTLHIGHAVCPRCLMHVIPEYGGASSRAYRADDDIDVEVCSGCGTDEAHLNAMGVPAQPSEQWPVRWLSISMEMEYAVHQALASEVSSARSRDN